MPIPTPKSGESKKDFISRCMENETMKKEYSANPDNNQRYAICINKWKEKEESYMSQRNTDFTNLIEVARTVLEGTNIQTAQQLAQEIEKTFQKYFPQSGINAKYTTNISPSIMVTIALAANKSEAPNNIIENDPMMARFAMHLEGSVVKETGMLSGDITVERFTGVGLGWHSSNGYQKIKVPFRKTTGDPQKILKAFDRHFSRLRDAVKENAEELNAKLSFDVTKKVK